MRYSRKWFSNTAKSREQEAKEDLFYALYARGIARLREEVEDLKEELADVYSIRDRLLQERDELQAQLNDMRVIGDEMAYRLDVVAKVIDPFSSITMEESVTVEEGE